MVLTFSPVMFVALSYLRCVKTIVKTACDLELVSFMLVAATVLKNIHVQIAFYSVSGKLPRPSCLKLTTLSVNKKLTFKHTCMICKNTALFLVRKNLWMQRFLSCLQKEWAPLILREQSYWALDNYLWHWMYFKGQVDRRMRDLNKIFLKHIHNQILHF